MKIHVIVDRLICEIEKTVVASGIIIISGAVILNVICRYFRIPITGLEEVCKIAVIWLAFMGGSLCTRRGLHVAMTAVQNKLTKKQKKILIILISLVSGIYCLIIGQLGWKLTCELFSRGNVSSALRIPVWYIYISFPIGYWLSGITFLRVFIKNLSNSGTYIGLVDEVREDLPL